MGYVKLLGVVHSVAPGVKRFTFSIADWHISFTSPSSSVPVTVDVDNGRRHAFSGEWLNNIGLGAFVVVYGHVFLAQDDRLTVDVWHIEPLGVHECIHKHACTHTHICYCAPFISRNVLDFTEETDAIIQRIARVITTVMRIYICCR